MYNFAMNHSYEGAAATSLPVTDSRASFNHDYHSVAAFGSYDLYRLAHIQCIRGMLNALLTWGRKVKRSWVS